MRNLDRTGLFSLNTEGSPHTSPAPRTRRAPLWGQRQGRQEARLLGGRRLRRRKRPAACSWRRPGVDAAAGRATRAPAAVAALAAPGGAARPAVAAAWRPPSPPSPPKVSFSSEVAGGRRPRGPFRGWAPWPTLPGSAGRRRNGAAAAVAAAARTGAGVATGGAARGVGGGRSFGGTFSSTIDEWRHSVSTGVASVAAGSAAAASDTRGEREIGALSGCAISILLVEKSVAASAARRTASAAPRPAAARAPPAPTALGRKRRLRRGGGGRRKRRRRRRDGRRRRRGGDLAFSLPQPHWRPQTHDRRWRRWRRRVSRPRR